MYRLPGKLLHYSDRHFTDRINRVNAHSSAAARQLYQKGVRTNWVRILFKPAWAFFSNYFFKLGFLDGYFGFFIARSSAIYVFLREMKLKEYADSTASKDY